MCTCTYVDDSNFNQLLFHTESLYCVFSTVCYADINERIKQAGTLITGRRIGCPAASVISYF